MSQLTSQREVVPQRHTHRLHRSRTAIDRSGARDPHRGGDDIARVGGQHAPGELGQRGPDIASRGGEPISDDDLAIGIHDAGCESCRAEVDREVPVRHERHRTSAQAGPPGKSTAERLLFIDVTDTVQATSTFSTLFEGIIDNIATVVHGKRESIEFAAMALLAEGHLLIEDVPGVGKTSLAKALAGSIDCSWKRVQFTPDLLPTDLVGVSVYERSNEQFRFTPGPLFANIVLADEINRASPKTQSALLEAMEERQVSADGVTHRLEPPFMVIATQNPVEQEGTYRSAREPARSLPAADLTRLSRTNRRDRDPRRPGVVRRPAPASAGRVDAEVMSMIQTVKNVYLASALKSYMVDSRRGQPPPSGDRARTLAACHVAVVCSGPRICRHQGSRLRHARRCQDRRSRRARSPPPAASGQQCTHHRRGGDPRTARRSAGSGREVTSMSRSR